MLKRVPFPQQTCFVGGGGSDVGICCEPPPAVDVCPGALVCTDQCDAPAAINADGSYTVSRPRMIRVLLSRSFIHSFSLERFAWEDILVSWTGFRFPPNLICKADVDVYVQNT